MKLPRRKFLHLAAGAAALPTLSRLARAPFILRPALSRTENVVLFARVAMSETFGQLLNGKNNLPAGVGS